MKKNDYAINGKLKLQLLEQKPFLVTPYSLFLAEQFAHYLQLTPGRVVLDFGVGCGIQAIVASLYGAGHVYAVDLYQEALELTKQNAAINSVANITVINDCNSNWESSLDKKVDYIICNPASLPSPDQLEATFWAGKNGNSMILELIDLAHRILPPSGKVVFVHTSLVCLQATLNYLLHFPFTTGIVAVKRLAFRDFYTPLISYWDSLREKGQSFWLQENGQNYEMLYLIKAEKR